MLRRLAALSLLFGLTAPLVQPVVVFAQTVELDPGFDPNRVLDDADIFDVRGMTYDRMVSFLRSKGTLAEYRTPDIDGVPKTVPEIIWRVANSYKLNPKYLLVLIQKEQSLVEDPAPSQKQFDWAAGYGVCDTCSKNDPSIQDFKGFSSQVEWAAKQTREKSLQQILANGTTKAGKAPGKLMSIDGLDVTPVNNATAILYSYTPHIHGNLNLWRIWRRWFSLTYPDGTVVRAATSGKTYLIRLGQKRQFASTAVMASLVDTNKIVTVSDTELAAYADGQKIQFPKYALLRDPKKTIWLLSGDTVRRIADMKTFYKFGFNEDEILDVETTDLADYIIGPAINQQTQFAQGVVMQDTKTKQLWYVENDVKQAIPDKVFLKLYFKDWSVKQMTAKKLDVFKTGEDYKFQSGELVRGKTSPTVYVVEDDAALHPIPSADIFEAVGWKWKNVVTVPDAVLEGYDIGDPVGLQTVGAVLTSATADQNPAASPATTASSTILGSL